MNSYLVEFVGTCFFLYVIIATLDPLAIGAALAIAIILGGSISGGHYNPAVSVVMTAAGKLPRNELLPYVLAQILGGIVAFEIYRRM